MIHVLTGGPCSGKSTALAEIARRGFAVIPEAAAAVILEGILHPDRDPLAFQREVLRRQLKAEAAAPPGTVFEDRGIGDHFGYLENYRRRRGVDLRPAFGEELERAWDAARRRYGTVFLLEPAPVFRPEPFRREEPSEAAAIHRALAEAYGERHPRVVPIPWGPVAERVDEILRRVDGRQSTVTDGHPVEGIPP